MLCTLLTGVQAAIGGYFVGLYLYGSLASGDFDPCRSDIDFVVATTDVLPEGAIACLRALHQGLAASGSRWALKLEGAYVPLRVLRRPDLLEVEFPCLNEGEFYLATLGSDWVIQRHVLREFGVVVAGPQPRMLIDPVEPGDVRSAVLAFLREWWAPMLQDPVRLESTEYQAYAILTMCRALYTLEHGTVASKRAAARWAQQTLGPPWAEWIEWAVAWPDDAQVQHMDEAKAIIRHTLASGLRI